MDWNRVEGNWKEIKGKVKQQWGKLTDDDLHVIAGKQEQLEGRLFPVSNRRSDLRMLDRCASDRPGKRMGARWRNIGPDLPL
jgi:hypothetical protein